MRSAASKSRIPLVPALMMAVGYFIAYKTVLLLSGDGIDAGYKQLVVLTAVPVFLAAHGFVGLRLRQQTRLRERPNTIQDVTTNLAMSVWEIFFCWIGISVSLIFLFYFSPVNGLGEWYPRLFIVTIVFFAATSQKALVFVYAVLPFMLTLSGLTFYSFDSPFGELAAGNFDAIAAGLFVALNLALLAWTVSLTARHGVFDIGQLQLPAGPGVTGGRLRGMIRRSGKRSRPATGYQLDLSCVSRQGSGKERRGEVLWHSRQLTTGVDSEGADQVLPVEFDIPEHLPPSEESEDAGVYWTLRVRAELPENNFGAVFEVPVRDSASAADADVLMESIIPSTPDRSVGRFSAMTPEGHAVFDFPAPWTHSTELLGVSYFLFWVQLAWMTTSHDTGAATWLLFAAGLAALVVVFWSSLWSIRVVIADDAVRITESLLGFRCGRVVPGFQVDDILVLPDRIRTGLIEGADYYKLRLQRKDGRSLTVGRHIRERRQADRIAVEMTALAIGVVRQQATPSPLADLLQAADV